MKCKARQYSDQKVCHDCHLVWDMNDPHPPRGECELSTDEVPQEIQSAYIKEVKNNLLCSDHAIEFPERHHG